MRWEQREYLKTPNANGNARVHPEIEIRRLPRRGNVRVHRSVASAGGIVSDCRIDLQFVRPLQPGQFRCQHPPWKGRKSRSPHASEGSVSGCFGRLRANVHASRVTCPKMQRLRHRKILPDPLRYSWAVRMRVVQLAQVLASQGDQPVSLGLGHQQLSFVHPSGWTLSIGHFYFAGNRTFLS
jgi:hypothetical protein